MADDLLEGVTTRTTKEELMKRLTAGSDLVATLRTKLQKQEKERLSKLQEIEQRVRDKRAQATTDEVQNVIVSATKDEIMDTFEFLDEFGGDLLPVPLKRLWIGSKVLLGKSLTDEDDEPTEEETV